MFFVLFGRAKLLGGPEDEEDRCVGDTGSDGTEADGIVELIPSRDSGGGIVCERDSE